MKYEKTIDAWQTRLRSTPDPDSIAELAPNQRAQLHEERRILEKSISQLGNLVKNRLPRAQEPVTDLRVKIGHMQAMDKEFRAEETELSAQLETAVGHGRTAIERRLELLEG